MHAPGPEFGERQVSCCCGPAKPRSGASVSGTPIDKLCSSGKSNPGVHIAVLVQAEKEYLTSVGVCLQQRLAASVTRLNARCSSSQKASSPPTVFQRLSISVFNGPTMHQVGPMQDSLAMPPLHGLPCGSDEVREAARLTAAHYRFNQALKRNTAPLEVPLSLHAPVLWLQHDGDMAPVRQQRPRGGAYRGSIGTPLDFVYSRVEGRRARSRSGCHSGSIVPVASSPTVLVDRLGPSGMRQSPLGGLEGPVAAAARSDSCTASSLVDTIKQQAEVVLSELKCAPPATPVVLPSYGRQDTANICWCDKKLDLEAPEANQHGDVGFLSAVLANEPLCTALGLRADNVQRTMLMCEGLTIKFLHDLGHTDQGVRSCTLFSWLQATAEGNNC